MSWIRCTVWIYTRVKARHLYCWEGWRSSDHQLHSQFRHRPECREIKHNTNFKLFQSVIVASCINETVHVNFTVCLTWRVAAWRPRSRHQENQRNSWWLLGHCPLMALAWNIPGMFFPAKCPKVGDVISLKIKISHYLTVRHWMKATRPWAADCHQVLSKIASGCWLWGRIPFQADTDFALC